ncbi:DUF86 domain-containing protein [Ammoniphilus resinae]|uniref:Uncharacterized protein YutE (UPF0331/DUF86 family) n=1 Tax=Ammoniphilus resinae TaxID=861532 RepID=A0ABS4GWH6_9BACL|nr:DUF86 domain-containing protein [Ammoniphilus resinae]MBP1934618.1 uncharacterized protein YutE (UPF0331/DUF86 family) [Ammoniphilus resinae]
MYNVDTNQINHLLDFIDSELIVGVEKILLIPREECLNDPIDRFALERISQLFIEAMTDIGNLLIDGFIMRDPGSYEDIVDIMADEKVYSPEQAEIFKRFVLFRKSLVGQYTDNISESLYDVYQQYDQTFRQYTTIIRSYLEKELW